MKVKLDDGTYAYLTPYKDGKPECTDNEKAGLVFVAKQPMPGGMKIHKDILPFWVSLMAENKDGIMMWAPQMRGDGKNRIARYLASREEIGHKVLRKWLWYRVEVG